MPSTLTTTLHALRVLCKVRDYRAEYDYLKKAFRGTPAQDPIPLSRVLEVGGLSCTLPALCVVPGDQEAARDSLIRTFTYRCFRDTPVGVGRVMWDYLPEDRRDVVERYGCGEAPVEDLLQEFGHPSLYHPDPERRAELRPSGAEYAQYTSGHMCIFAADCASVGHPTGAPTLRDASALWRDGYRAALESHTRLLAELLEVRPDATM